MATKRQRGNRWEFIVRRKGLLPKPKSFTFATEAEGDAYCAQLEALLDQGIVPDALIEPGGEDETGRPRAIGKEEANRPQTINKLLGLYRKRVNITDEDDRLLTRITEEVGGYQLAELNFAWAESWVATSLKQRRQLKPGTVRKYVGALARCLDFAVAHSYLGVNPLRLLKRGYSTYTREDRRVVGEKVDVERNRRLEASGGVDEQAAIERVILAPFRPEGKQRALELEHRLAWHLMFVLAVETAMRMREIYTLDRYQIDLNKQTIFLEKTKNGDNRQVPLSSVAVKALRDYLDVAKLERKAHVFPFWNGLTSKTALTAQTSILSRQWGRIFKHAGCQDLRFHDLRHEATCRFYERTDLTDVQIARITGHRDLRNLRRYASLRGSDLAVRLW